MKFQKVPAKSKISLPTDPTWSGLIYLKQHFYVKEFVMLNYWLDRI